MEVDYNGSWWKAVLVSVNSAAQLWRVQYDAGGFESGVDASRIRRFKWPWPHHSPCLDSTPADLWQWSCALRVCLQ